MKIFDKKSLYLKDTKTVSAFIEWLKEKKSISISRQRIHYQLEFSDKLDYCEHDNTKYIIMNDKSKNYI